MSNFDFVTDSKLSQGTYDSNNKSDTATINGWRPLYVVPPLEYKFQDTFGAQLYTKDGVYKVAFRGTEGNLADWAQNLKYGTFQWSKEFEDTVVFMASAIKQIAERTDKSIEEAAKLFSTTGHSQGGFEAELSAVLFGLKGTSLDGMGATGVVGQFRAKFTEIMQREGLNTLAVDHVLGEADFGTRIYTAVGYLGVHAGDTDGSWSWSLTKIIGALNPAMAGAVLTGGLLAHKISDIVANEELRAANPTWKVIGDAGSVDNPTQLANDLTGKWSSVQVAWAGAGLGALPDNTVANGLIKDFLQSHAGDSVQYWQDNTNKTLRIELSNGDSLLMYQDGRVLKTNTSGVAIVQTLYAQSGDVSMRSSMQLDDDGNALVTRSGTGFASSYVVSSSGQLVSGNDKTYDAQNNLVSESVYHRNDDNTVTTNKYNSKHELVSSSTSQTFDDGTQIEIRSENGHTYVRSLVPQENGTGVDTSEWRDLATSQTLTQQAYQHLIYSDMAGFLGALRTGDKLNQALYGAKMAMDVMLSQGQSVSQSLGQLRTGMDAVSGAVGVVASLHALQSHDTLVQLGAATGLLSSSNQLVAAMNGGAMNAAQLQANGFMSGEALKSLSVVTSVLAIANLRNLDDMLNQGRVGSAGATMYQAYQAVQYLSAAAEASSVAATAEAAAAADPDPITAVIIIAAAWALDSIFSNDPPPPPPKPPVGWAEFKRVNGQLTWVTHDTLPDGRSYGYADTAMGKNILDAKMQSLITTLNQQVADANKTNTDADRALVLVASRIPKVLIQSWISYDGNGVDNYHYLLESRDAQSGEKTYQPIARQDISKYFSATVLAPEALLQQWQVNHLTAKFGADENNWLTEGQYLNAQSPIEAQRSTLKTAWINAQKALDAAKAVSIDMRANDDMTPQEYAQQQAAQANKDKAIAAAQATLNQTKAAYELYNAQHPQDAQLAATDIDSTNPNNSGLWNNAEALLKARDNATHQWLKVIALDWDGNGSIAKLIPKDNLSTDLRSMQRDGAARFDVDNDGYREVTEWVGNTDAVLGIDRDGNGLVDTATELFDAPKTTFDQRGLNSLKYYDSNNDGKLTAADKAWKLLRVWMDVNGDGSAGALETLNMDMNYVGVDMAALRAGLDAAGKAALDALQALKVTAIDLATHRMTLANGSTVNMVDQSLKAEVLGTMLQVNDETQNITVLKERKGAEAEREQYITALQDLSVLQELKRTDITQARRDALLAMAVKYGLDPKAKDFNTTLDSLVAGINTVLNPDPTKISADDVAVDMSRLVLSQLAPVNALWAQTSTNTGFAEHWTTARLVSAGEVKGDTPQPTQQTPTAAQWVLPTNMYALDYVAKGAQQGGLVTQQAVVVSQKTDHTAVPAQTVQVYTTATPSMTLNAARYAGKEDEGLSLGYLQLEQEARGLFAGGASATLKLLGVREVRHGAVTMDDANGVMRFVPDADYSGSDAGFTYVLADAAGRIMQRRVDLALAEVNDAPTVLGETVATVEDVPLLFNAATLLANDTDKEGDVLRIIGIGRVGMGKATLEENGQIRYVPPQDLYGVTDTLEYLVQDARGAVSIGVVKIKLAAVADAPTVTGEVIRNAQEDQTLYIEAQLLLANDFDPDVDARVGGAPLRITAVSGAVHGTVFLDASGNVIFVPESNFHGTASFNYTVTDATGLATMGKAEIAIAAVNDGPQALGETIQANEDEVLTIDPALLLANDVDADIATDGQKLHLSALGQDGQFAAVGGRVELVNGKVVFTPTANRTGQASFTYFVTDDAGGVSSATVKINLAAVNDAPVVPNRTFTAVEDTPLKIRASQLKAGVTDVEDGTTGLALAVDLSSSKGGSLTKAFDASVGEDVYTFTPTRDFNTAKNGLAGFSYSVTDKDGAKTTASVNLDVSNVNDAPVFVTGSSITKAGAEDTPMRLSEAAIAKMFSDADGDALSVDVNSLRALNAGDGIRFDTATREVVFTPAVNANGVRQIALAVKDPSGASSGSVTLNLNIAAVNDAPVVNAFGFQAQEDAGYTNSSWRGWNSIYLSDILAKATDADGDALSISWVGDFSVAGTQFYIDAANGKLQFMTPQNYYGGITFNYTVSDGHGGNTTQTAWGVITPVNDAPDVSFQRIDSRRIGQENASWRINVTDVDDPVSGYSYAVSRYSTAVAISAPQLGLSGGLSGRRLVNKPADSNYFVLDEHGNGGWNIASSTSVAFQLKSAQGAVYEFPLTYTYWYDPIVIDLKSDGLSFINARDSKARFDVNGDGVADQIAWAGSEDAMLVYDYNNDGLVTRFDELAFGTHLKDPNPNLPDLQALARPEFDANQDGVFNANDAKWSSFKLWQDKNSNGAVDAGEMQSLSSAGVSALYLHANVLNHSYGPDVSIRGFTRVQMSDGRMLQAGDAQLGVYDPSLDTPVTQPPSGAAEVKSASAADVQAQVAQIERSLDAQLHAGSTHFSGALDGAAAHQKALVGMAYDYVLPTQLFTSAPAGSAYVVTLADGSALPNWLSYDASTHTLSGTPTDFSVGHLTLKVSVPGQTGGVSVASGTFELEVAKYNQAPEVYGDMPTQFAAERQMFSLDVAPNFFIDRDATDALQFSAKLANGQPLPSWLHFDAQNLRFEGTPSQADVGNLEIVLTAQDAANATASEHFYLVINNVNDAPTLVHGLQPFGVRVGQANSYVIGADTFADADIGVDANEHLTLSVLMADGSALPAWLKFTTASGTLTATPTANDVLAPIQLRVIATDTSGTSVSTLLEVGLGQRGTAGSDNLVGSGASEYLWGETGNDTLNGAAGADVMYGGLGDDVYVVDAFDTVVENANEGIDTVQASMTYSLANVANVENLTLTGTAAINGTGNALNNVLVGNGANNVLDGGAGVDTLQGGAGNDIYIVDSTTDTIVENLNEGTDTIQSSVTYTLGANVENLTLTGTAAINGTGNALNNVLVGNGANNVLDGGAGVDTLQGGAGNDVYIIDSASDVIIELANEGTDTARSSVTYALAVNVENLTLIGTAAINGTGNASNNVLMGNSANNTLDAGAGDDTLDGGAGVDTLQGGAGNDIYIVDSTTDTIVENLNEGTDTIQSRVTYTLGANVENLTLTGTAAINGTGNALNNVMTGNAANNFLYGNEGSDTLDGGAGNDYLYGGAGNDIYVFGRGSGQDYVSDNDSVIGNMDVVQLGAGISTSDVVMTRDQYNLYLSIAGTTDKLTLGNWFYGDVYRVEQVKFADGTVWDANTLITKSNIGTVGADSMFGTTGADRLVGLAGNDTYTVNNAGDEVVENANEGTDTVQSSVTYTLGANLENLTLTGSAAINGTGNELANTINGNGAANVLDGGAGNDYLYGGAGNDTYVFGRGSGQDMAWETSGNADVVLLGVGVTVADVVMTRDACWMYLSLAGTTDKLTMYSWYFSDDFRIEQVKFADGTVWDTSTMMAKALTVTAGNDNLTGTSLVDALAGGLGNDTLTGGAGADRFVFDAALGGTNVDTITDFTVSQGDQIALDDAVFTKLLGKTSLVNNFRFSTQAAVGGDDYIVYNASTGQLSYDATGSGSSAGVVFATLQNKPQDLTAQQFVVI